MNVQMFVGPACRDAPRLSSREWVCCRQRQMFRCALTQHRSRARPTRKRPPLLKNPGIWLETGPTALFRLLPRRFNEPEHINQLPTPPSTLWKIGLAGAVFTGIGIWQQWDIRIVVIGAVIKVLMAGLFIYAIYTEKKMIRIKKEADRLMELERRKTARKRKGPAARGWDAGED